MKDILRRRPPASRCLLQLDLTVDREDLLASVYGRDYPRRGGRIQRPQPHTDAVDRGTALLTMAAHQL